MGAPMASEVLDALLGHLKEQNAMLTAHPNSYVDTQTAFSPHLPASPRAPPHLPAPKFVRGHVDTWTHTHRLSLTCLPLHPLLTPLPYAPRGSYVYTALSSLVEIDGHFLESEPLHASNQPELPSQSAKLDALKACHSLLTALSVGWPILPYRPWYRMPSPSLPPLVPDGPSLLTALGDTWQAETKFTESCQIVKFAGSYTIHSGVLRISDIRRTSMVASINIYCHNKPVNDVGELKNKWELWKRVKTLAVPPGQVRVHRLPSSLPMPSSPYLPW